MKMYQNVPKSNKMYKNYQKLPKIIKKTTKKEQRVPKSNNKYKKIPKRTKNVPQNTKKYQKAQKSTRKETKNIKVNKSNKKYQYVSKVNTLYLHVCTPTHICQCSQKVPKIMQIPLEKWSLSPLRGCSEMTSPHFGHFWTPTMCQNERAPSWWLSPLTFNASSQPSLYTNPVYRTNLCKCSQKSSTKWGRFP